MKLLLRPVSRLLPGGKSGRRLLRVRRGIAAGAWRCRPTAERARRRRAREPAASGGMDDERGSHGFSRDVDSAVIGDGFYARAAAAAIARTRPARAQATACRTAQRSTARVAFCARRGRCRGSATGARRSCPSCSPASTAARACSPCDRCRRPRRVRRDDLGHPRVELVALGAVRARARLPEELVVLRVPKTRVLVSPPFGP